MLPKTESTASETWSAPFDHPSTIQLALSSYNSGYRIAMVEREQWLPASFGNTVETYKHYVLKLHRFPVSKHP